MLGEPVGEERGKVTSTRVLSVDAYGGEVEVSFSAAGTLMGLEVTDWGTYRSVAGTGGVLSGEGQGILMTRDGESITWTGQGTGRFTGPGNVSWRGAIYYHTSSQKLARLNGLCAVYEYEVDAEGNTRAKTWEWK